MGKRNGPRDLNVQPPPRKRQRKRRAADSDSDGEWLPPRRRQQPRAAVIPALRPYVQSAIHNACRNRPHILEAVLSHLTEVEARALACTNRHIYSLISTLADPGNYDTRGEQPPLLDPFYLPAIALFTRKDCREIRRCNLLRPNGRYINRVCHNAAVNNGLQRCHGIPPWLAKPLPRPRFPRGHPQAHHNGVICTRDQHANQQVFGRLITRIRSFEAHLLWTRFRLCDVCEDEVLRNYRRFLLLLLPLYGLLIQRQVKILGTFRWYSNPTKSYISVVVPVCNSTTICISALPADNGSKGATLSLGANILRDCITYITSHDQISCLMRCVLTIKAHGVDIVAVVDLLRAQYNVLLYLCARSARVCILIGLRLTLLPNYKGLKTIQGQTSRHC